MIDCKSLKRRLVALFTCRESLDTLGDLEKGRYIFRSYTLAYEGTPECKNGKSKQAQGFLDEILVLISFLSCFLCCLPISAFSLLAVEQLFRRSQKATRRPLARVARKKIIRERLDCPRRRNKRLPPMLRRSECPWWSHRGRPRKSCQARS